MLITIPSVPFNPLQKYINFYSVKQTQFIYSKLQKHCTFIFHHKPHKRYTVKTLNASVRKQMIQLIIFINFFSLLFIQLIPR